MNPNIKVGFLVSYDWHLLKVSIPRIYNNADKIFLAIDKNRVTWSGNKYSFNDKEFFEFVSLIDAQNKIEVYEDVFFIDGLSSMQCETRERNKLANYMAWGGWHIQLDADEYFIDFGGFVQFLKRLNESPTGNEKPYNVHVSVHELFKRVSEGYLYIKRSKNKPNSVPVATTRPCYETGRHNHYFNRYSPFYVLHETWARSEEELKFKISNWGHSTEELKSEAVRNSYINLWRSVDQYNYQCYQNLHFAKPSGWPALGFVEADGINDYVKNFPRQYNYYSRPRLMIVNNRNVARVKHLISKGIKLLFK